MRAVTIGGALREPRLYPVWVLLVAAAVLLPRLGSYGLWEPHEIEVAGRANAIANEDALEAEAAIAGEPAARRPPRRQSEPDLTEHAVALGLEHLGGGEGAGRLPLALLALVTVLATFFLGARIAGPRAGLFAALILLSFPLLILNGRHLTSDIGSIAGTALMALGLVGLLTGRGFGFSEHYLVTPAIDAVLIAAGGYLAYEAAGVFLGLLPPLAGCGLAAAGAWIGDRRSLDGGDRLRLIAFGSLALVAAAAALVVFTTETFNLVDPPDGDDSIIGALFGKTFEPAKGYVDALGGTWRARADLRIGFSTTLEQMAFGTFPWIAIIPIAVAAAFFTRKGQRRDLGLAATALWAVTAYLIASIFVRKVTGTTFPALAALAVLAGVWLDRAAPREGEDRGGLPLVALFAVCCAVVVGRDFIAFADRLTSLNLPRTKLAFPEGVTAHFLWIGTGWATALAVGVALLYRGAARPDLGAPRYRRIPAMVAHLGQRGGVIAALGLGVASALVLTQVVTPALSAKLSTKSILSSYRELARDGDLLGIMGGTAGAAYYAGADYETIRGRKKLVEFLQRPERVFALAPRSELCPLNREARKNGFDYFVVDRSSAKYRLFSNKLRDGETDHNPLAGVFLSEPPDNIRRKLSFNLDNQLELIGVSMPDSARRGSTFTMRLYFKVLERVSRNWKKVLVHFDKGVRFQADHEPIDGLCGTAYWVPGDIVVDEFEVTAGSRAHPYGEYTVWTGLFVGSAPNWTNMKVVSGGDKANRIPLGKLRLR